MGEAIILPIDLNHLTDLFASVVHPLIKYLSPHEIASGD